MANPSKQRPWVVEMNPPSAFAHEAWYLMDAYRSEDEAKMQCALMQKRSPRADFRYRHKDTEQ